MDYKETLSAFDKITVNATKLQALCNIIIDPTNNDIGADIQSVLYVMLDYINEIKNIASQSDS